MMRESLKFAAKVYALPNPAADDPELSRKENKKYYALAWPIEGVIAKERDNL
jgi:hypothetical protein